MLAMLSLRLSSTDRVEKGGKVMRDSLMRCLYFLGFIDNKKQNESHFKLVNC